MVYLSATHIEACCSLSYGAHTGQELDAADEVYLTEEGRHLFDRFDLQFLYASANVRDVGIGRIAGDDDFFQFCICLRELHADLLIAL